MRFYESITDPRITSQICTKLIDNNIDASSISVISNKREVPDTFKPGLELKTDLINAFKIAVVCAFMLGLISSVAASFYFDLPVDTTFPYSMASSFIVCLFSGVLISGSVSNQSVFMLRRHLKKGHEILVVDINEDKKDVFKNIINSFKNYVAFEKIEYV